MSPRAWFVGPMHRHGCRLLACVLLCGLGCAPTRAVQKPTTVAPAGPAPEAAAHASQVHADVSQLPMRCEASAKEACNAIDEDCNGVIDDGCGYSGGAVQVTAGWDTGADIDLYVYDPSGVPLYYNEEHRTTPLGGHMDQDARGDCRKEQSNPRVENAFWPAPAPRGTYTVELHYFGPCGDFSKTHVTVSVSALGKPVGVYGYELKPEERVEALSFVVP